MMSFRIVGILLLLYGIALAYAGYGLVAVGGSPAFLLTGVGTVVSGMLVFFATSWGWRLYAVVLLGTAIWAAIDGSFILIQVAPRVGYSLLLGLPVAFVYFRRPRRVAALLLAAILWQVGASVPARADEPPASEWNAVGRTLNGTRYTTADQITPENVKDLKVAWTYRTGEDPYHEPDPMNMPTFEATPIKDGDTLYFCTPRNQLIALNAETGQERWRYDPKASTAKMYVLACRGVSLYKAKTALAQCQKRIIGGTIDGRMFAVDAESGKPCEDFGDHGIIDLKANLGAVEPGTYGITSPPTVANDTVMVGAFMRDNQGDDMPSGVVRAYDPMTGKQLWAWDTGRVDSNPTLAPGETYTRGSPGAWSIYSADEQLGLVYIPTGGGGNDYFGGNRTPIAEKTANAVVALDIATGAVRWSFQTSHHDLWDYDVAGQPVLADFDTANGKVPAVFQATKRGELFVLDRRDGTPLSRVEERPVPGDGVAGEHLSPTQPFSVDMPSFAGTPLNEASMWGVSPFDMIACRTKFLQQRYDGVHTPPSLQGSIHYPSNFGASNWGSVSIDPVRKILMTNTTQVAAIVQLITRAQADAIVAKGGHLGAAMTGTPYASRQSPLLSPLRIPCNAPPWGLLTAVDLTSKKILWQKTLGTTQDKAPLGIPLPLGMPNVGGSVVTKSGLVFIGAAIENAVRAFDETTGAELWKARLPASVQATPMTYISERDGRQYLVVAAGGHSYLESTLGDYVIAFALPPKS